MLVVALCSRSRQRAFRLRPALFHCQSNSMLPISNCGSEPDLAYGGYSDGDYNI